MAECSFDVVSKVDLAEEKLVSVVEQEHAVLAWGGRVHLMRRFDAAVNGALASCANRASPSGSRSITPSAVP